MDASSEPGTTSQELKFSTLTRALKHRNYRLFFAGQGVSLIGTWMQQIAMGWLVYRLTDSAFMLGFVTFLGQIPTTFLAPLAGVLADRRNRHRILIITQTLAMVQAFILAALVFTDTIAIWQIIVLASMLGLVNAFDIPARQSFVINMVEKEADLGNAIALNSSMVNSARLVGPSIAGLLIAAFGEGICFLINGVSFMAVIAALLAMRINFAPPQKQESDIVTGLKEGIRYAYETSPIRAVLILLAVVSLIGMPYAALLPILARDVLKGGPQTLGFLMGSTGIGALTGALFLASRKDVRGLGRVLASASSLLGVGLILLSFSRIPGLSIALMFIVGLGMMMQIATSNTILQTIVDEDKRGRIVSLFVVCFMGMLPLGNLLAGTIAGVIGAPLTLLIDGAICILASLAFALYLPTWRKYVRPIYINKGIIPDPKVPAVISPQ